MTTTVKIQKVFPITKSIGNTLHESATYKYMKQTGQPFLYLVGYDVNRKAVIVHEDPKERLGDYYMLTDLVFVNDN